MSEWSSRVSLNQPRTMIRPDNRPMNRLEVQCWRRTMMKRPLHKCTHTLVIVILVLLFTFFSLRLPRFWGHNLHETWSHPQNRIEKNYISFSYWYWMSATTFCFSKRDSRESKKGTWLSNMLQPPSELSSRSETSTNLEARPIKT